jgi:hypothetical protein
MRSKWYNSNAPALQMALMKLIASPEELKRLSMTYTDNETKIQGGLNVNVVNKEDIDNINKL